jgi:hypothetical protein
MSGCEGEHEGENLAGWEEVKIIGIFNERSQKK